MNSATFASHTQSSNDTIDIDQGLYGSTIMGVNHGGGGGRVPQHSG